MGDLREDDRQEDYQEKIAVQLAEQEEDDLERIKEESRRRRQAILEKYKNKQQKPETRLQGIGKDVMCLSLLVFAKVSISLAVWQIVVLVLELHWEVGIAHIQYYLTFMCSLMAFHKLSD